MSLLCILTLKIRVTIMFSFHKCFKCSGLQSVDYVIFHFLENCLEMLWRHYSTNVQLHTKVGHLRDVLPSQSHSMALKKQNLVQQKQTCINKLKDITTQNITIESQVWSPDMMSSLEVHHWLSRNGITTSHTGSVTHSSQAKAHALEICTKWALPQQLSVNSVNKQ